MKKHLLKTLSLFLCFIMVFTGFSPVFGAGKTASDIESHWARKAIQSAIDSGIVNGYPDGSFKPDNAITRAEFFALVNNAYQLLTPSDSTYTDVPADAWYAPVIAKAKSAGYISGYPDGTIHPNGYITRQEAAFIISQLKSLIAESSTLIFYDAPAIPDWSKWAIIGVVEAKIMIGYPDNSFRPTAQIKRAEALVSLNNSINYKAVAKPTDMAYDQVGTYGSTVDLKTIEGNATVNASGVTLQNMIVKGDLTIAKEVGEGDVTLNNVVVKGNTYVNGGGVNSIYFVNVTAGKVFVLKDGGPVRIVASGTSAINQVIAGSDVKLEEVNMTGAGFEGITVEANAAGGIDIILVGVKCESIDIKSLGVTLNADKTSTVAKLTVDAAKTEISGLGVIASALINADGVIFEVEPTNIIVAAGIKDPTITLAPIVSDGGGGGGGGSTTPVTAAVTAIGPISGTAQVGSVLTSGALTPSAATVGYQWIICATPNGTYAYILGATASTYTPVPSDAGKYIKVIATGTGSYSGTVTSTAAGAVATVPIAFTDLTANGTSGTATTTELTLTFDIDPASLAEGDITVTGATKGALVGTGTTRTLGISSITVTNGDNVTVELANPAGFILTPTSRVVVVNVAPVPVAFTGLTANGVPTITTTSVLTLTFDVDPTSLAVSDITVTGATKGTLTGSGTTRTLGISAITVANGANVTVTLANPSGFAITPTSRDVAVSRGP